MKTQLSQLCVNRDEKEAYRRAASISGIPLSAWVRERFRLAAIRELEGAGQAIPIIQPIPLVSDDA